MKNIIASIDENIEQYMSIVEDLYNNPELGNEEFRSSKILVDLLADNGFKVEYPYIQKTGFKGVFSSGKKGAKIALLCEYDALPEVGHGCGHNMIGVVSIAAAISLKQQFLANGGDLYVYGTPAEENFGGKVIYAEAHEFDDFDAALMMHPSNRFYLGGRTNALNPIKFEFFGKNAHGCRPEQGRSALDAAVLTYTAIDMLRQFQPPYTFIHGIIRDGGQAANVIPGYASMEYYFRGTTMKYVKELTSRAIECAEGAAKMTGTTFKYSTYETPYDDCNINYTLCNILKEKFIALGVTDELVVDETPSGSSDIGAISYKCPILHGDFKIASEDVLGHSKEMALSTISKQGKEGFLIAAKALALVVNELIENPEKLRRAKEEFANSIKN